MTNIRKLFNNQTITNIAQKVLAFSETMRAGDLGKDRQFLLINDGVE